MPLHKLDDQDIKPCRHMEKLVSCHVDGNLSGIAKIYTDWHVSQCPRCQAGMNTLVTLKNRLSNLDADPSGVEDEGLPQEKWRNVEAEWSRKDSGPAAP